MKTQPNLPRREDFVCRMIHKNLSDIIPQQTSHGCGEKRVLMAKDETETDVTQVAVTQLKAGECIEEHTHDTMEEMFFVLEGSVAITADGAEEICKKDDFIHIKARTPHSLKALSDVRLMTVGCAVKEK